MSLAAMKKKSHAIQFEKVSAGGKGFNINGTMRRHVYTIPNNMQSRIGTPHTRFGGPQGHGSKSWVKVPSEVVNNVPCTLPGQKPEPEVSVKTTSGSHAKRFLCLYSGYPNSTFKLVGGVHNVERTKSSTYTANLKSSCGTDAQSKQIDSYPACENISAKKTSMSSGPCASSSSS